MTLKPLNLTDTLHDTRAQMLLSDFTTTERNGLYAMDDAWFAHGIIAHADVFIPIGRPAKDQNAYIEL